MNSNSDVDCLLHVYNAFKEQVIVEFLVTEPFLGELLFFFARMLMFQSSVLGESILHIKRYILSRNLSIWKGNTIMSTQKKYTEMFGWNEHWNKSPGI